MTEITVFDIPSRDPCRSWSLNTWKTRLALHYKGIDYNAEWVEFPDIEELAKSYGLAPNDTSDPHAHAYTIPIIRFKDSKSGKSEYVMDSRAIAEELERRYPSPSLLLEDPLLPEVEAFMPKVWTPLIPVLMGNLPRNVLTETSASYYHKTRSARDGAPLDEIERRGGGDVAWNGCREPLNELDAKLKKNGGPFLLGQTPSYADFFIYIYIDFPLYIFGKMNITVKNTAKAKISQGAIATQFWGRKRN
ncbi:hypothetical protein SCUP234_04177 [Seiridium cupressi]